MAIGSVSTPTGTGRPAKHDRPAKSTPSRPTAGDEAPRGDRPVSNRPLEGWDDPHPVTAQRPSIPNAPAIVQAVTGRNDLEPMEASAAIESAFHGDRRTGPRRSSRELRRDGTHQGPRDAQIATARRFEPRNVQVIGDQQSDPDAIGMAWRQANELRASIGMNAIADTLHVLGADEEIVDVLEDPERVKVVADESLSGSAAYDSQADQILVSQTLADRAYGLAGMLAQRGILDADGRIVQGREDDLDANGSIDELIKIGTLIAVHEQEHSHQHDDGDLDLNAEELGQFATIREAEYTSDIPESIPITDAERSESFRRSDQAWAIERTRVAREEYDAYLAQEVADLELGAALRVQIVTDIGGAPLPKNQAVENIVALERGVPLPHGPDAGWIRTDALETLVEHAGLERAAVPWSSQADARSGSTMVGEQPGWKRPGQETPGWKRPGIETPGWKRPGVETPGWKRPGYRAD